MSTGHEHAPLLGTAHSNGSQHSLNSGQPARKNKTIAGTILLTLLIGGLIVAFSYYEDGFGYNSNPLKAAQRLLDKTPVIVSGPSGNALQALGIDELLRTDISVRSTLFPRFLALEHIIDLPILVRGLYGNNITKVDLEKTMPGHVDIPRLRAGRVGGFFW